MSKPMRDEVSIKDKIVVWRGAIKHGVLIKDYNIDMVVEQLCDAYIAQEEELEEERDKARKLHDICVFSEQTTCMLLEHSRKLEAENQEWERKCRLLCCRVGVLEMENQELKADLRECIDAGKASMYAVDSNYYKCQEADELFSELSSKYKLEPQP